MCVCFWVFYNTLTWIHVKLAWIEAHPNKRKLKRAPEVEPTRDYVVLPLILGKFRPKTGGGEDPVTKPRKSLTTEEGFKLSLTKWMWNVRIRGFIPREFKQSFSWRCKLYVWSLSAIVRKLTCEVWLGSYSNRTVKTCRECWANHMEGLWKR